MLNNFNPTIAINDMSKMSETIAVRACLAVW